MSVTLHHHRSYPYPLAMADFRRDLTRFLGAALEPSRRVPTPKGVMFDVPLRWYCRMGVGGSADVMVFAQETSDLSTVWKLSHDYHMPTMVMGLGSNVLIRDGGMPGLVVRPVAPKNDSAWYVHQDDDDDTHLSPQVLFTVHAGTANVVAAHAAMKHGLSGIEFLCGIPGAIGGAVAMNAGCYGTSCMERVRYFRVITAHGERRTVFPDNLAYGYRCGGLDSTWLVSSVTFALTPSSTDTIRESMKNITTTRRLTQPYRARTCGSTFMNPDQGGGETDYDKAWKLIDSVGGRDLVVGDATVSSLHCNFLINRGQATARDVESLGLELQRRVWHKHKVALRWEVIRCGVDDRNHSARAHTHTKKTGTKKMGTPKTDSSGVFNSSHVKS